MSHKPEQLANEIMHAVQQILARGLSDPRVSGLITITKAHVQQDLKRCEISVSVLPQERESLTMHGLRSAARHIRREVGDMVRTRSIPELVFVLDGSLKKEAAVLRELQKVREERGEDASTESAGGNITATPEAETPEEPAPVEEAQQPGTWPSRRAWPDSSERGRNS